MVWGGTVAFSHKLPHIQNRHSKYATLPCGQLVTNSYDCTEVPSPWSKNRSHSLLPIANYFPPSVLPFSTTGFSSTGLSFLDSSSEESSVSLCCLLSLLSIRFSLHSLLFLSTRSWWDELVMGERFSFTIWGLLLSRCSLCCVYEGKRQGSAHTHPNLTSHPNLAPSRVTLTSLPTLTLHPHMSHSPHFPP